MDKEQKLAQFQSKTKANIMRKMREGAVQTAPSEADRKRLLAREN